MPKKNTRLFTACFSLLFLSVFFVTNSRSTCGHKSEKNRQQIPIVQEKLVGENKDFRSFFTNAEPFKALQAESNGGQNADKREKNVAADQIKPKAVASTSIFFRKQQPGCIDCSSCEKIFVEKTDNLEKIAQKYQVPEVVILAINDLKSGILQPGQVLKIPKKKRM